ncbi:MAG: SH3 domain-containing protein [Chloroflexi bacterium]|nr:SH3 domain-containing protein [Chloroflexota bacterium]
MRRLLIALCLMSISLTNAPLILAQDPACEEILEATTLETIAQCGVAGRGQLCSASDGYRFLDDTDNLELEATANDFPAARINFTDDFSESNYATGYVFGTATVEASDNWHTLQLTTAASETECAGELPLSGLLVQAPSGQLLVITVNDVELTLNDTVFITTVDTATVISILRGNVIARYADSIEVTFAGYSLTLDDETLSPPAVFDEATLENLPVELLPSVVIVPLPGNVILQEPSPLFANPRENAAYVDQLRANTLLNLLGQNEEGDWWHVVREDGVTGWLPAEIITGVFPSDAPHYAETPQPLTRPYGLVMGRATTPANPVNLRSEPLADAEILVQLPALTDFSIMGRNETGEWLQIRLDSPLGEGIDVGWVAAWILDLPDDVRIPELPIASD